MIILRWFIYISDYVLCCKIHEISYCIEQKAIYSDTKYLWDLCALKLNVFKVSFFAGRLAMISKYLLVAILPTFYVYI